MDFGKLAVDKALKLGMDEAEAYVTKNKQIKVGFASEIQEYVSIESIGLGLRVAKGKKLGMHSTTILTKSDVEKAVEKAVNIAKVSPEDPNWNGFNDKFGKSSIKGLYDKTFDNLGYDKIIDKITGGINKASEDNRKVLVTRGAANITIGETSITNNYHDTVSRKGTFAFTYLMTKAVEGGDSTGAKFVQSRTWDGLTIDDIAVEAAEQALRYVGAKTIDSTKTTVIMKNTFASAIFGLMFAGNINSEAIQKGRSTFAPKKGTQLADERLTIIDEGLKDGGYRSREFDCEGHPTLNTPIIENGILKNFIYDNYRAKKEGIESSGNARRNYWQLPNPSVNNFVFKPGSESLEDMIKETKKGFLIERSIGEWLSKPQSGEINATITHGFLIENGELTKPVNNVILAGNFFELIKDNIVSIGNDIINSGAQYIPSIKISDMPLAGK